MLKQLSLKLEIIPDKIEVLLLQLVPERLDVLSEALFDLESLEDLHKWLNNSIILTLSYRVEAIATYSDIERKNASISHQA